MQSLAQRGAFVYLRELFCSNRYQYGTIEYKR
jgi:hypothetical protein